MHNIIFEQNKVYRHYILNIIKDLSIEQLLYIPTQLNNSILWNLGHVVVSQQMLTYGLSGQKMNTPIDWTPIFKIGSKGNIQFEEEQLTDLKKYMVPLIEQTENDFALNHFENFKPFYTGYGAKITNIHEALAFNNYHEGNHIGHILTMKKLL